jgi:hypothetical protein
VTPRVRSVTPDLYLATTAELRFKAAPHEFTWWNDWIFLDILALQDPNGEGRNIVASRDNLDEAYKDSIKTAASGDAERLRAEDESARKYVAKIGSFGSSSSLVRPYSGQGMVMLWILAYFTTPFLNADALQS